MKVPNNREAIKRFMEMYVKEKLYMNFKIFWGHILVS